LEAPAITLGSATVSLLRVRRCARLSASLALDGASRPRRRAGLLAASLGAGAAEAAYRSLPLFASLPTVHHLRKYCTKCRLSLFNLYLNLQL
jgi:hypothetical protein